MTKQKHSYLISSMLAEKVKEIVNEDKSLVYTKEMLAFHYCSKDREKIILIEVIR